MNLTEPFEFGLNCRKCKSMKLCISHLNTHRNARMSYTHPPAESKAHSTVPTEAISYDTQLHSRTLCRTHGSKAHTPITRTGSHTHVYISTRHSSLADWGGGGVSLFPQSPSPPPHLPHRAHTPSLKGYGHSVILLAYFRITLSSLKMKRDLLTVKQFCLTGMGL